MAGYFDPSPRETKRRRTGTYGAARTTLDSSPAPPAGTTTNSKGISSHRGKLSGEHLTDNPKEYGDANATEQDNATESEVNGAPSIQTEEHAVQDGIQDNSEDTIEVRTRSSGRQRRRPKRFSPEPVLASKSKPENKKHMSEDVDAETPSKTKATSRAGQPKGILTPSRRDRTGPRKSVVFNENEKQTEQHLGFKDVGSSARKLKKDLTKARMRNEDGTPDTVADGVVVESLVHTEQHDEDDNILLVDNIDIGPEPISAIDLDTDISAHLQSQIEDDPELLAIKSTILSRLVSSERSPIAHLDTQYTTLHTLLSATITSGESNSMLLLGSRGSGKTLLIETTLADLTSLHASDFHTIRLNGFYQTDDKLALREIWRQLGREMQISEDETSEVSTYADTMASLLSLLSHPEEFADPNNVDMTGVGKTSKSVVFILDEFDLFTTHPRQTLLYNLFDIAQARKAPIAVIGCSTRMDVVDCLEKRVKSRFSHRWLHVPSTKSLVAFEETIKSTLHMSVDGKGALVLSREELTRRARWNDYMKASLHEQHYSQLSLTVQQNTFIPSPSIQALIKKTFYTTKSIPDLLTALYIPIATLSLSESQSTIKHPPTTFAISSLPSLLTLLPTLPTLHLSLLLSSARLDTIHSLSALNFTLAYSHLSELVTRMKIQSGAGMRLWSKEVAKRAWEELGEWEVIVPVGGLNEKEMWRVDVTLEEVAWAVREKFGGAGASGVGDVLGKWCREI